MKIDVFNHVFPTEFFEAAEKLMPARSVKRWKAMEELYDMDARMKGPGLRFRSNLFRRIQQVHCI